MLPHCLDEHHRARHFPAHSSRTRSAPRIQHPATHAHTCTHALPTPARLFFHASICHLHKFLLAAFQTHDALCPSTPSNIRSPHALAQCSNHLLPPRVLAAAAQSKSTAPAWSGRHRSLRQGLLTVNKPRPMLTHLYRPTRACALPYASPGQPRSSLPMLASHAVVAHTTTRQAQTAPLTSKSRTRESRVWVRANAIMVGPWFAACPPACLGRLQGCRCVRQKMARCSLSRP